MSMCSLNIQQKKIAQNFINDRRNKKKTRNAKEYAEIELFPVAAFSVYLYPHNPVMIEFL